MSNETDSRPSPPSHLLFSVIVILLFGQTFGCGKAESVSKTAPEPLHGQASILEIYTESKYSVYPPGKRLDIKVYASGQAEYDRYPPQQSSGKFEFKRTNLSLSSDELEKIKILTERTFIDAEGTYGPSVPILDAAVETTIVMNVNGSQKKIVLTENHSNLILEKKKGVYPESLLKLLLFIQEKNDKLLGIQREVS